MARKPNLWKQDSDLQELRRTVRRYNAKIKRERDKLINEDRRYEAAHLPQKAYVKDLRNSISSRKEYEKELNRMEDYIKNNRTYTIGKQAEKMLHATIRDFNTKVDKVAKKTKKGELGALPEKLNREVLIRNASNEKELMRNLGEYKKFLKAGAEELIQLPNNKNNRKLTKWESEWREKKAARVNQVREREKEAWLDSEVKFGGRSSGYTHRDVRAIADEKHMPINIHNPSAEYRDIRQKSRLLAREDRSNYWDARTELARINYTETMEEIMGNDPVGKHLLRKIKSMPLSAFKRVLQEEDNLWVYLYEYSTAGDERSREIVLRKIWGEWETRDIDDWREDHIKRQMRKYE